MGLKITYPKTNEGWHSDSSCGSVMVSAACDVPVKILIVDKNGQLISCDYQYCVWSDDYDVGSENIYVPSKEKLINPETLEIIKKQSFESESEEGEDFHDFIRNLMCNPLTDAKFIKYDGVEKVISPKEYWIIFGIKIAKRRRIHFVHHFSIYRLCRLN